MCACACLYAHIYTVIYATERGKTTRGGENVVTEDSSAIHIYYISMEREKKTDEGGAV